MRLRLGSRGRGGGRPVPLPGDRLLQRGRAPDGRRRARGQGRDRPRVRGLDRRLGGGELPARGEAAHPARLLQGQGRPPARAGVNVAEEDNFLSRWSRRKSQARSQPGSQPAPQPPVTALPQAPAAASAEEPAASGAPPAPAAPAPLPPVESLTPQSDFTPFMAPEVDAQTRSQALKALFADPHFNTMDMMDVYVDDYSKPDPLPASWLEKLEQLSHLGV
ncbi:MAG: DUF3306 domain-containing protein [Betaproteobacteria bacterium]|nr:DUF3306 domain-containing protein [Betaproteobacteria bacterium]